MKLASKRGLTLVEILVALALLGLLAPLFAGFFLNRWTSQRAEIQTQAVNLARERLEALRLQDPQALPRQGCDEVEAPRGPWPFRLRTCYCPNPNLCGPGARHVAVQVLLRGQVVYQAETVFTQLR